VKSVYNNHPRGAKIATVVDRWSLDRDTLMCLKRESQNLLIVVALGKWSLAQVWLYFNCSRAAFLNPNYSATRFYHNLGRGRKAILYGSLLSQFYLPPTKKKGLKVFKNVYIWVDIIFFTKYPINWLLRLNLYFWEKVPRPARNLPRPVGWERMF